MTSNLRFTVRDLTSAAAAATTTTSSTSSSSNINNSTADQLQSVLQPQSMNETSIITSNNNTSSSNSININNNSSCSNNSSSTSAAASSGLSNNSRVIMQQLHHPQQVRSSSHQQQQQLSCSSFSVDDNNCISSSSTTTGPIIVNPLISPMCDDGRGFGLTDEYVDEDDNNDQIDDGEDRNDGADSGSSVPSPVNESAFNPSSGLFSHHESMMSPSTLSSSSSKPNVIFNGSSLVNACNDYESRMQLVNSLLRCKPRNVRSSSHHRTTTATAADRRRGNLISNPWESNHPVLDFDSINSRYGSRSQDHRMTTATAATPASLLSKHLHPNHHNSLSHPSSSNSMTVSGNSEHVYECIDADSVNNFQINDYHVQTSGHSQHQHQQPRHRSLIPSDPRILNV